VAWIVHGSVGSRSDPVAKLETSDRWASGFALGDDSDAFALMAICGPKAQRRMAAQAIEAQPSSARLSHRGGMGSPVRHLCHVGGDAIAESARSG
jgi:hypothetical protein